MNNKIRIICVITCLLGLSYISSYAEQATVVRDGSLLFELPDVNSSVVDILPKGKIVETVARSGDFTEVVLSENGTRGFLRNTALTGTDVSLEPPKNISSMSAEESFNSMNRDLDNLEQNVMVLDKKLGQFENLKEKLPEPAAMPLEKEKKFPPAPFSSTMSVGVFGGYLTEVSGATGGISILWFSGKLSGVALELEATYSSLDYERESYGFNAGLLFPFPWKVIDRLTPYIVAGGGMDWAGDGIVNSTVIKSQSIAGFSAGGGIMAEINTKTRLRADFRTMLKIADSEDYYEGRGYLSLMRDF